MTNIATVLKEAIQKAAKKEAKAQLAPFKTASSKQRKDIAALKRTNTELGRKLLSLERQVGKKKTGPIVDYEDKSEVRFAPEWVERHRLKIDFTQAEYGKLCGVTGATIYNWEAGNSRPRTTQLAAWGSIKKLGKREAMRALEALE